MKSKFLAVMAALVFYHPAGLLALSVEPAIQELAHYQNIRDFTVSASGNEAYLTVQSPLGELSVIASITRNGDNWSEPEIVGFSGRFSDMEPFLSVDDTRLYFVSNRPLDDSSDEPKDYDIWYVERTDSLSQWSSPKNLGSPVNTEHNEFYPSVAANGNLYLTSDVLKAEAKDNIFFSAWDGQRYAVPVSLGGGVNTAGYEFNSFISPDESYLIYSGYNREGGLGSGDLYISHRQDDGGWGESQNLGNSVNSKSMDYCPFVDVASKTLYFTSKRSEVKNKRYSDMEDYLSEISRYENGFSRLYKVSMDELPTRQIDKNSQ